jgi:hypothetical protein
MLQDLINLLRDMNNKQKPMDTETIPDTICGEWTGRNLGICLSIRKEYNNYYASVRDVNGLPEDYRESYPVRKYKNICYFILDTYAIFIEYDKDNNQLILCGNLSLVRLVADMASYPVVPLDFSPN